MRAGEVFSACQKSPSDFFDSLFLQIILFAVRLFFFLKQRENTLQNPGRGAIIRCYTIEREIFQEGS